MTHIYLYQVQFILSGDEADTDVRTLADPHRKILQRGGIDSFILAVPSYAQCTSLCFEMPFCIVRVGVWAF